MRVLVTRPETEAQRWARELREHGIDAVALPLIEIAPPNDASSVRDAWKLLPQMRAVMFVSGNAVRHLFAQAAAQVRWPAQVRAWATGNGTRVALLDAGVEASVIDSPGEAALQFDSETLWQQVGGQITPMDRVLIVRGADAGGVDASRDWLASQLAAAGARVDIVVAYVRQSPALDAAQSALAREACADGSVWLFSSSQAIANLLSLVPHQDWTQARAVATHPRIAHAAREAGFGVVCESRPAMDAVVTALKSFR
jgi:uroporphyrinogen-III synthase